MKKVAVIGLGIIGASISGALTSAGYLVYGADLNEETVGKAKERGYIQGEVKSLAEFDAVFIAVPPKATIEILRSSAFQKGAFVADICGIKEEIERAVYAQKRDFRYIGLHPMAGKETSGIDSASPTLFQGANLVMTVCERTEECTKKEAEEYATAMGFGKLVVCTAAEHDKKIALTSQLAHIVSNAYVKSGEIEGCEGFTGGSFQDMTRIAGVDEKIWTQLYNRNRKNILVELGGLINHLKAYQDALENEDDERLSALLKEGRLIREKIKTKDE